MPETVGVFGGTFDPPHLAHVLVPAWVLARGFADRVLVVPSFRHPFGKPGSAPWLRRLGWARAAFASYGDAVDVDDLEEDLGAASEEPVYTIDVLEALAQRDPGRRYRLVAGADALAPEATARWRRWDELRERFDPILVPRVGWSPASEAVLPAASSTQVRELLARGEMEALERDVPAGVRELLRVPERGRLWIVGRGAVGCHLASWAAARGFDVERLGARRLLADGAPGVPAPAAVVVCCGDPWIPAVAAALVRLLPPAVPVLHTAGALRAEAPAALGALAGARAVGTLHPICSLRARGPSRVLQHAAWGVEVGGLAGGADAAALARALVAGRPVVDLQHLDEAARLRYHAACALASNYVAEPEVAAQEIFSALGVPEDLARLALRGLADSARANVAALGPRAGISGPVARGDLAAAAAHAAALPEELAVLYRVLAARLGQRLG